MKLNISPGRKARIEMVPLIDTVFLILVFFIYSMLSMSVHRGLPVLLPASTAAGIEKDLMLSVTVKSDGTVYIDSEKVSSGDLTAALQLKAGKAKEPGVVLFADGSLSYQKLFNVLDQIKKAGISRISLQAEAGHRQ
ncbi:MAG: biopolymer transporter ExbD [Desulfobacteraceae bacterium]|nr:MAG: biopolymer transporter ExbD [Desulfobacteraceae bacterium]